MSQLVSPSIPRRSTPPASDPGASLSAPVIPDPPPGAPPAWGSYTQPPVGYSQYPTSPYSAGYIPHIHPMTPAAPPGVFSTPASAYYTPAAPPTHPKGFSSDYTGYPPIVPRPPHHHTPYSAPGMHPNTPFQGPGSAPLHPVGGPPPPHSAGPYGPFRPQPPWPWAHTPAGPSMLNYDTYGGYPPAGPPPQQSGPPHPRQHIPEHLQHPRRSSAHVGDRVDPFMAGANYGPVLDPFLIGVLSVQPKFNPLLEPLTNTGLERPHLKWTMLFDSNDCRRSTDPSHVSWSAGRDEPATYPRITSLNIVSETFPWMVVVRARDADVGVTCGEVIDTLSADFQRPASKADFQALSPDKKQNVREAYLFNRSRAPGVPGGRLKEGMQRLDYFGKDTVFGGIYVDSRVVSKVVGAVLPCTFVLKCVRKYALTVEKEEERRRAAMEEEVLSDKPSPSDDVGLEDVGDSLTDAEDLNVPDSMSDIHRSRPSQDVHTYPDQTKFRPSTRVSLYAHPVHENSLRSNENRRPQEIPSIVVDTLAEPSSYVNPDTSHVDSATASPIPDAWHQTQFSETPDAHSMGYLSLSSPDYWNSTPQHLTMYITADEAYAHITNKELEFRNALAHVGYEGGYSLHAGFNEELIHVGRQQEEIYVILDSAVSSNIVSIFEAIISPFPGVIYTPDEMHLIPTDTPKLLPIGNGIRAALGKQMALGASQPTTSISGTGGGGESSGSGGDGKGQGREDGQGGRRENDGDNDRGRGGSGRRDNGGGDSDGDGDGADGGAAPTVDDGPRLITIQFSSTLSSGPVEDQQQLPINFKTASGIDIMINENRKGDSPPTGFKFPGPWFGVDMTLLDVATHNSSADVSKYTLSFAEVRITASLCPTGIIDCSPGPMHADEDTAKAKTEWNATGGAWATFSATPNLRLGGTVGRTVGVERTQRRYEILMHHLDESDSSVHAGEYSRGIVWKYAHNGGGGVFERVAAERFQPKPAVVFGLDRLPHHPMPLLEVEVVVYWSLCDTRSTGHGRQYLFPFLRSKKLGEAGIPVFLNFLHHVSVAVDLGTVEQGKSWVADGAAVDKTTTKGLMAAGGPVCFQPIHRTAKKGGLLGGVVESDCKIVIKRAVAGRVAPLTEVERAGAVMQLRTPARALTSTVISGLPTPSSSPSL